MTHTATTPIKAVIFDMDGTILDTLDDLWGSVNHALALHQMPARPRKEVRRHLGNGMENLIRQSVPAGTPDAVCLQVLADFKAHYAEHCHDKTRPYPGISDLIARLRARGLRCAVVSNKGDFAVQQLVERYFPKDFDMAAGERAGIRRKPAPDVVNAVLDRWGLAADECVYVGDSEVDIQTARNVGCACVVVDWGFRDRDFLVDSGATCIVSSPDELLEAVCPQGPTK